MRTGICVVAGTGLLLWAGCSKEKADTPPGNSPASMERFDPPVERIRGLVRDFQRLKERHRSRDGEELGERPLNETVWISEADANYTQGDASDEGIERTEGLIEFTMPVHQKADGSLWVDNADLLDKQDELLNTLAAAADGRKIYLVDVEMTGTDGEEAHLEASWVVMSGAHVPIDMPLPGYTGCWPAMGTDDPLDDAADVMRIKLKKVYPVGTYFTSVSKEEAVSDITPYGLGPSNYTVYYGTRADLFPGIGPGLIHTGQNGPNEICFPDYWNKFVLLRDRRVDPSSFPPGREIVINGFHATYAPLIGVPMNYGSPYYPMGPYHHIWIYQTGIPMTGH